MASSRSARAERRTARDTRRTAARSVGTRVRHRDQLSARLHGAHPSQARARPVGAAILHHRAGHGIPVRGGIERGLSDPRRLATLAVSAALAVVIVGGAVAAVVVSHGRTSAYQSPRGLTVNGGVRPVGVDPDRLAFAWRVTDHRPGARQTAYRI